MTYVKPTWTKVSFDYNSNRILNEHNKIRSEIEKWLIENTNGKSFWSYNWADLLLQQFDVRSKDDSYIPTRIIFHFEDKNTALLFKLTWG